MEDGYEYGGKLVDWTFAMKQRHVCLSNVETRSAGQPYRAFFCIVFITLYFSIGTSVIFNDCILSCQINENEIMRLFI